MGTGFTLIAGIVGGIREILGEGTVFGAPLARFGVGGGILPLLRFPAGGFLVLGLLATLATRGSSWDQRKGEEQ
jgi:electron transport complex protein RnfE